MGSGSRRLDLGLAGLALALAIAAASAIIAGDHRDRWFYDEAWMIQVLDRVLAGEVLYRDVFLGVTPLSVYLLEAAGWLFGAQAWLLRALNAICMLAMAAMTVRISRKFDLPWTLAAAAALCVAAWMRPIPAANYSYVAQAFLMAAACALLEQRSGLAGALAGLAFASKQNTGLLALALVLLFARRQWLRPLAAFSAVVALALAPVLWSGGAAGLLDFGFLGKAAYVKQGGLVPPVDGLQRMTQMAQDHGWLATALSAMRFAPFLFALAPIVLLRDRRLALPAALGLASLAAAAPRFDLDHLRVTVPACLCALAILTWHWKLPRPALWLAAPALVFGLYEYGVPLAQIASGESKAVALPHYRYVYAGARQIEDIAHQAEALRRAAPSGDLYLQSPRAGILYLLSGVRNRTPFDYPLISTFGRSGQQRVIRAFERGSLGCAWVEMNENTDMAPVDLIRYINTLPPAAKAAGGTIHCR